MYGDRLAEQEQDLLWNLILSNENDDEIVSKWNQLIKFDKPKNSHRSFLPNQRSPFSFIPHEWFMTLFSNQLPIQTVLRVVFLN